MRKKSRFLIGFTLIELWVVIAIISLLSNIVLASLTTARAKARDARRLGDAHAVIAALELYYQNNGKFPIVTNASGNPKAYEAGNPILEVLSDNGKYLSKELRDPSKYYAYGSIKREPGGPPSQIALFWFLTENEKTPCPGSKIGGNQCTIAYPAAPLCSEYPHLGMRNEPDGDTTKWPEDPTFFDGACLNALKN